VHRRSPVLLHDPSKLARHLFKGWGLSDLPLRAPNEGFLRHSFQQHHTSSFPRESPDYPSLRASDEHMLIVRVLRARRMVRRLPSRPSEAARCASTEDHQAPSPPLFRDQEDDQTAPSPPLLGNTLQPSDSVHSAPRWNRSDPTNATSIACQSPTRPCTV
jgi:hypothetical protein